MSTDRQRVKRAIQRIAVQAPELQSFLDDAEGKGGKPRSAGVGGGAGSEEGSNVSNETRICCDGSVSDEANPGVDERDTTDGDQDGLNPEDPADLGDLAGGCLTGVTNCDTGEAICFCGDDFIPPDDWDAPDDPPVDDSYVEGTYWRGYKGDLEWLKLSAEAVRSVAPDTLGLGCAKAELNFESADGGFIRYRRVSDNVICDSIPVNRETCNGEAVCDDPVPTADAWPADSCVNLAVKGGTIVGSKYDPENDGSYSSPRSEIHLCDGANDMYLAPSATGGWKTIDSTRQSGYLFGKDFKMIAHIDGAEYSDPTM